MWNHIFAKLKKAIANQPELATDASRENFSEASAELPDWLTSSSTLVTLKNYFGDRVHYLSLSVGSKYPRRVGLLFLEETTDPDLISEFFRRVKAIRTEWLAGTDHLVRFIRDRDFGIFPEFQRTQQAESAAAFLQSGQIILAAENDPTLLIAPAPFLLFFQKSNFTWGQWLSPGLILRLGAFGLAVFLPALYMSIVSYQYYTLPVKLFMLLAESRMKAPFPPLIEVLTLEVLLEMFQEGAFRSNHSLSSVTGTLGGLFAAAGIAAVGLVTPAAALFCGTAQLATTVLSVKDLLAPMRWLKYGSIIMTAIFGVLGTVITASLTVAHLVSLELSEWPYIQIGKRLKRYRK